MLDFLIVQTAINSPEAAQRIADAVVSRRLAASCWVSGPIVSTYWWQGRVEQAREWICTIKTRRELYEQLEQVIQANHPYEVPGIQATPVWAGSAAYLAWLTESTGGG
jgi:periplasmic divalent cation tolerance protein